MEIKAVRADHTDHFYFIILMTMINCQLIQFNTTNIAVILMLEGHCSN